MCDRVSDCALAVVDEGRFWVEVFTEFMEWDEASQQRWADAQLSKLHTETTGRKSESKSPNSNKMTLQEAVKTRTLKKDK